MRVCVCTLHDCVEFSSSSSHWSIALLFDSQESTNWEMRWEWYNTKRSRFYTLSIYLWLFLFPSFPPSFLCIIIISISFSFNVSILSCRVNLSGKLHSILTVKIWDYTRLQPFHFDIRDMCVRRFTHVNEFFPLHSCSVQKRMQTYPTSTLDLGNLAGWLVYFCPLLCSLCVLHEHAEWSM